MGKALTPDLILARAKTDNLYTVKKVNLWGNDIEDVKLLRQMPNVEVLSLSVNRIASLKEFSNCAKLQELYLRKNNIADLSEIRYLINLQELKILWLWDNPCADTPNYREYIIKMLPNLVKLDNETITPEERSAASKLNINFGDFHVSPKEQNDPYSGKKPTFDNIESQNKYSNEYQNQIPPSKEEYSVRRSGSIEQPNKGIYSNPSTYTSRNNENILSAIFSLLKELDDKGLEFVKEDIDKKLSTMRVRGKD